MDSAVMQNYLDDARRQLRALKTLADRAIAQVDDADLFRELDAQSNPIAVIMIHMAGNMRSRWTDFLTSDGEKPDRNRDNEFVIGDYDTRAKLTQRWQEGWACLFGAVDPLTVEDLSRTVAIRSEAHSVIEAINRQLTHYATHVGQIALLARHWAGDRWQSLSIPRGASAAFNAGMQGKCGGA